MTWSPTKGNSERAIIGGLNITLDAVTGKGEIQPGPWFTSFRAPVGDIEAMRAEAIKKGHDLLIRTLHTYRERALEMGYAIAPPTFIE